MSENLPLQMIYEEGELLPEATHKKYLSVRQKGSCRVQRELVPTSTNQKNFEEVGGMSWQKVKISELGRVVTGKTPPTKQQQYYDGDFPFITPSDLEYDTYRIRTTTTSLSDEARSKFHNQFIEENEFFIIKHTSKWC